MYPSVELWKERKCSFQSFTRSSPLQPGLFLDMQPLTFTSLGLCHAMLMQSQAWCTSIPSICTMQFLSKFMRVFFLCYIQRTLLDTWYIIILQLLGCIFLAILSLPSCYITIASRLTVSFDASGAHLSASRPFGGPDRVPHRALPHRRFVGPDCSEVRRVCMLTIGGEPRRQRKAVPSRHLCHIPTIHISLEGNLSASLENGPYGLPHRR